MARRFHLLLSSLALTAVLPSPALAQQSGATPAEEDGDGSDNIVVTAARTILPPNALPLTIDVIDKKTLDQQIAISGSVTDAVANLTPSFSPTRQKLSGAGETLRGRSPLYAINGIPQSTPLRDGSRDGFTIDGFFVDRVELIYGSNALQGIGGTGGIVNQVTVGAPSVEGISGRALLQGSADTNGIVKDTNVSPDIQRRFAASYAAAGGKIQLELLPGAPHNFVNMDGPNLDRALAVMKIFIETRLAVR